MNRQYILVAGANGVGKSTLAHMIHGFQKLPGINLDNMVREIGDWRDPIAIAEAGKKAVSQIREYFEKGCSFWQETTLCGRTIHRNIRTALERGYDIHIHYIGVETAEIAVQRIKHRVEIGGHGIPEEDVKRRFKESLKNIEKMLPLCKRVYFYDNTEEIKRIALFKGGSLFIYKKELPHWFKTRFLHAE